MYVTVTVLPTQSMCIYLVQLISAFIFYVACGSLELHRKNLKVKTTFCFPQIVFLLLLYNVHVLLHSSF